MGRRSRKSGGNKGAMVAELATASKTFIILDAIRKVRSQSVMLPRILMQPTIGN